MDDNRLLYRFLVPLISSIGAIGIGLMFVVSVFPEQKMLFTPPIFLLGAILLGYLTPTPETEADQKMDATAINATIIMMLAWSALIAYANVIFPNLNSLSEWVTKVMGTNILIGFSLIIGAYIGIFLQRKQAGEDVSLLKPLALLQQQPKVQYWVRKEPDTSAEEKIGH
jgi:hypothetical protein